MWDFTDVTTTLLGCYHFTEDGTEAQGLNKMPTVTLLLRGHVGTGSQLCMLQIHY